MCVAMEMSQGERAGTLHERVADVLNGRTVVERVATLHKRAVALGALHGRDVLHERAEPGALRERAGTLCKRAGEGAAALLGGAGALGALSGRAA